MIHSPAVLLALGSIALAWFSASAPVLVAECDPLTVEASEYEALITAFDAVGLSLDDPELQNLDNGELWALIEAARRAGKERGDDEQADADY